MCIVSRQLSTTHTRVFNQPQHIVRLPAASLPANRPWVCIVARSTLRLSSPPPPPIFCCARRQSRQPAAHIVLHLFAIMFARITSTPQCCRSRCMLLLLLLLLPHLVIIGSKRTENRSNREGERETENETMGSKSLTLCRLPVCI